MPSVIEWESTISEIIISIDHVSFYWQTHSILYAVALRLSLAAPTFCRRGWVGGHGCWIHSWPFRPSRKKEATTRFIFSPWLKSPMESLFLLISFS